MTENKRLIVDEDYNIVDTVTGEWLDDTDMFDLVNELHEENKEPKKQRDCVRKDLRRLKKDYLELSRRVNDD